MSKTQDPFKARTTLTTPEGPAVIYRLKALQEAGIADLPKLPYTIRVLLEAALRNLDEFAVTSDHVRAIAAWADGKTSEVPFLPARVILQDFTGVPSVVDLAALRSAMARLGGDPDRINPRVPVDLIIDHSLQVDHFGSKDALQKNAEREFERNRERYEFLHWGQSAIDGFRVVPPASGIIHQVNLEYLATVVSRREVNGEWQAFPDTLVGTDSHTTMVNGLGVLGWGVGGIEAEAVMLGQPIYMLLPRVVGVKLTGRLPEGITATDLVLRVTEMLRGHGVVGKFVEYFGEGLQALSLADRATLANMGPEYGATCGFFPADDEAMAYLRTTGRSATHVEMAEQVLREQGLFWTPDAPTPEYTESLELDLASIVPSIAGPKRPQDRIELADAKFAYANTLGTYIEEHQDSVSMQGVPTDLGGHTASLNHGDVVIASINSCTNTSNPSVLIAAGLLAKKAVEKGLTSRPWVKTSFAPGSRVVTRYLEEAGLIEPLEALGFHVVGYGCATCIGNSGPLLDPVTKAVVDNKLMVTSVSSGNRNFEGRISPLTRANYLMSPPLVVAYALVGNMIRDITKEPLGKDKDGSPVTLADIWPSNAEVQEAVARCVKPEMFGEEYGGVYDANAMWNQISGTTGNLFSWDESSTYIKEPSFFQTLTKELPEAAPIEGARVLALLGDSITTDHISPAGSFTADSPAGKWLTERGVEQRDFNSYGSRRGNHEVMMRGTFANIRLRNQMAPGTEGGFTKHVPSGEVMTIFEAANKYKETGTPLVVLAGKEYGTGSSRDWAAKGTILLGVRAVIAETYERIHRSNLVFMGVLPLQFKEGETWQGLGLTGQETLAIEIPADLTPGQELAVTAVGPDGTKASFKTIVRVDSPVEVRYFQNGGILHTVLRDFINEAP